MIEFNPPKVSIVVPNLNNRSFLEERFQSIINQTFTDWELVVVDNYSDDGAWELIQEYAKQESRMYISQAPRKGIYANWNNCIRLARGEYIYIAPNDDSMTPNCLEKMLAALKAHPDCEICHCCIKVIDSEGKEIKNSWRNFKAPKFYGELIDKTHKRFAPYDGILYCALDTVFFGPLQLLIRRSVFEKVGLFRTDWGPDGDFEWGMRATLVCNTIHIPEILAAKRIHPQQTTNYEAYKTSAQKAKFIEMVKAALPILEKHNPKFSKQLRLENLLFVYERQRLRAAIQEASDKRQKLLLILNYLINNPRFFIEFLYQRFLQSRSQDDFTYIRKELKRLGLDRGVEVIDNQP